MMFSEITSRNLLVTYFNFDEKGLDSFLRVVNKYKNNFGENPLPELEICQKECENPFKVDLVSNLLFELGVKIVNKFCESFYSRKSGNIVEISFDIEWLKDEGSLVDSSVFGGTQISSDLAIDIVLDINAFLGKKQITSLMEEYYEVNDRYPKWRGCLTDGFKNWVRRGKSVK